MSRRVAILFLFALLFSACAPASVQTPEVLATVEATSAPTEVTATPSETNTATPSPVLAPNVISDWEMGCLKADMCMGLEVADGHKNYMMMAEGFVASYENRAWMASMGINDVDGFMKFLETSEHLDPVTGEMRKGWIPLVAPDGESTFKILQGNGSAANGIFSDKNQAIVKAGGFFFDKIGFVAAPKAEIDANVGGVADWINKMEEQNGRNVLVRTDTSIAAEMWGLAVVDGQLTFVGINRMAVPDNFPQKDRILGYGDAERDAQIMSSYYQLFTSVHSKSANDKGKNYITNGIPELEPDFSKWRMIELCVATNGGDCEGKSPSRFAGENALFVVAE